MKGPTSSGGPFHFPYDRVVVTGANGAGKTWFSGRVAKTCGFALTHNDALSLSSGWVYRADADIRTAQTDLIAQNRWLLEGGGSLIRPEILVRAEYVIWLDPPAATRCWRLVRRTVRYMGRVRPELPSGNVEWPGRRQVLFIWKAWRKDARVRQKINEGLRGVPHVRLRSKAEVQSYLNALKTAAEGTESL